VRQIARLLGVVGTFTVPILPDVEVDILINEQPIQAARKDEGPSLLS
jgi:hypothetical protein